VDELLDVDCGCNLRGFPLLCRELRHQKGQPKPPATTILNRIRFIQKVRVRLFDQGVIPSATDGEKQTMAGFIVDRTKQPDDSALYLLDARSARSVSSSANVCCDSQANPTVIGSFSHLTARHWGDENERR
jgi:hypothetical protein